jgi:hypothetical protein
MDIKGSIYADVVGPGFKSPGGYFCVIGILLLALSCYNVNNI